MSERGAGRRRLLPVMAVAASLSMGTHGAVIVALAWLALHEAAHSRDARSALAESSQAADHYVELLPASMADPSLAPITPAFAPLVKTLPFADAAQFAPEAGQGRAGVQGETRAPATDVGDDQARIRTAAWRRDRSTLRARVTDGSKDYQPSHERTGRKVSSPQALRREPVLGIGDSSHVRHVGGAATPPTAALPAAQGEAESIPDVNPSRLPASGRASTSGQGPLDADRGRKSFDVDGEGVAQDDRSLRAASNERNPGLVDFSAPGVGPTRGAGRGQGAAPASPSQVHRGEAPVRVGVTQPAQGGASVASSALEREYLRFELEIRGQIRRVLTFPPRLALALQQGETIVRFTVRPDGHLGGGVRVVKSAGFEEFDAEAVSAVQRAAPFPATSRQLTVSMRIPFENPVIRAD